jgi:hypothetical protein
MHSCTCACMFRLETQMRTCRNSQAQEKTQCTSTRKRMCKYTCTHTRTYTHLHTYATLPAIYNTGGQGPQGEGEGKDQTQLPFLPGQPQQQQQQQPPPPQQQQQQQGWSAWLTNFLDEPQGIELGLLLCNATQVRIPQRIPYGFHTTFLNEEQLALSAAAEQSATK